MKQSIFLFVAAFVFFSCGNNSNTAEQNTEEANEYSIVALDDLLENPDAYVDKPVKISGLVTHVCRHGGEKLFITTADEANSLKITTGGDASRFDVAYEGSVLEVEGVLKKLVIDEAYIAKMADEACAEHEIVEGEEHETSASMQQVEALKAKLTECGQEYLAEYWVENIHHQVKN